MNNFKSGFVTVIGRTNVGKSSLINKMVGEKVSAVADKTQTTRKNVRAIVNRENSQIIFIDTPGIHSPKSKLSEAMVESAYYSLDEVDVIVYVVDVTSTRVDEKTLDKIKEANKKTILVLNKIDMISPTEVAEFINKYKDMYDFQAIIPVSVAKNRSVKDVLDEIEKCLPLGPAYYDKEEYTDQTSREIVEETIREKALRFLRDEIPHGVYVSVSQMKSKKTMKNEKYYDTEATIYCNRDSHKGIIVGKNGAMLKRIGTSARKELEDMFGCKFNLKLWVVVQKDWINDPKFVDKFKIKK